MKLALAQRLIKLRKRSTFSMAEVARRSLASDECGKGHITQSYISRLEAGHETNPSLAKVLMLCRIYGTDPNTICGWKGARK